jgi:signal transduction histidine kinase
MVSDATEAASVPPSIRRRLTLRAKLRLGFSGLLLILLVVSGMSLFISSRYRHTLEQIFRENYDTITFCESMKQSLDRLDYDAQRMLWDNKPITQEEVTRWKQQFTANAEHQKNNTSLPGEADLTRSLIARWEKYAEHYDAFRATEIAERRTNYDRNLAPEAGEIRQSLAKLSEMNLHNMAAVDGRVRGAIDTVQQVLWLLAGVGAVLAIVFIATIGPLILRPLSELTTSVRQIAEGQLDHAVNVEGDDELGQLAGAFNVMTERLREFRRLDRDRLARTEQTTQMAIDSLPDAIVVLSPAGQIELANRSARERFSLLPSSPASQTPAWMTQLHEKVMSTGQAVEPQYYRSALQRFDNGEERFYIPQATPLLASDGRVVGVTVILSDVTSLKKIDEAKSDLVSTVSHELKTPLTNIRMATHMLCDTETFGALSDRQTNLLNTARDNTERLYQTVENLLGIGRLESGRAPLSLKPLPVSQVVEMSVEPLRQVFAHRQVVLDAVSPPGLDVMVDPLCVGHVLTNLLTNAAKHAPAGSRVEVRCESDRELTWICVQDYGPGILPEHVPHLFEKFFRVTRSGEPSGAGLGLAIARDVVVAHGGHIEVRTEVGKGTTFRFSLRRAKTN